MKVIPLTRGRVAVVDDADEELVFPYSWGLIKKTPNFYANAYNPVTKKNMRMHRLIMGLDGPNVDHIDGNGLNNQRSNLRLATAEQGNHNRRKRAGVTSRFKGVSWNRKSQAWRASIQAHGQKIDLGLFDDEIEAALIYDNYARDLHGEFARTNEMMGLIY